MAAPADGDVVVDVGCGNCRSVLRAGERVGASGRAIGICVDEMMLRDACGGCPGSLANVHIVKCDPAALALADNIADVVISSCTINHAADKRAVCREIHRVLKLSGRFVVADVVVEHDLPAYAAADPMTWTAHFGGAVPEHEYVSAIVGAGLVAVEVVGRTAPYLKEGVLVRSIIVRGSRA